MLGQVLYPKTSCLLALLNPSSGDFSGHQYRGVSTNPCFPVWATLTFALLPSLKLLAVNVGISLSAAKFGLAFLWIYLILLAVQSRIIKVELFHFIFIVCLFFVALTFSLVKLFFWPSESLGLTSISGSVVWYFIYPITIYILVRNTNVELLAIRKYLFWLVALCFLGYAQLALFFLGFNTSYEAVGEPAFENVSAIFGVTILRVNSIFGEPRDLAVICVALAFLLLPLGLAHGRKIALALISLALLTLSSSAILCLIGAGAILFFTSGRWFLMISGVGIALLVTGITIDAALDLGRLGFAVEVLRGIGDLKIPAAFNEQSVDLLVAPYILDFQFLQFPFVFGFGLGGEHDALVALHDKYSMATTLSYEVMSSRLIWFTYWLETGALGMVLLLFGAYVLTFRASKDISKYSDPLFTRRCLLISIWCSVQSTSYFVFFVIALIGLLIKDRTSSLPAPNTVTVK